MVINILFLLSMIIIVIQFILLYSNIFYIILLIVELIILIYLWFIINKRWNSKIYSSLNCNQLIIEIMKKFRHDMSNNIQIISCCATLKRTEDIINQITIINYIAIQQGLIAAFSSETLTAYLYKIHALFPNLTIDLEIEEDIKVVKGRYNEKLVYEILDKIIKEIYLVVDSTTGQNLSLFFGNNSDYLIINFEFEGNVAKSYNRIMKLEKKMIRENGKFVIGLNTDQRFIVDIHFPLRKA